MEFAYHRSLGPLIGIILALGLAETLVVHLVAMAWWGWKVAGSLGVLDALVLIALARLLRSFRRRPITLADGVLTLRTGHRLTLPLALADIAGLRDHWTADDLKAPHVLNMALVAWPNIVLDLRQPVARRRKAIATVAHRVDDPAAFRQALLRQLRP